MEFTFTNADMVFRLDIGNTICEEEESAEEQWSLQTATTGGNIAILPEK